MERRGQGVVQPELRTEEEGRVGRALDWWGLAWAAAGSACGPQADLNLS